MTASWDGTADAYHRSFARLCRGAVEPLLDAIGPPAGDRRLLDAGSGTGVLGEAAFGRGWRVDAVDLDPGMVAHLGARVPAIASRTGSMAALPYPDGAFDSIVACFSINHADHPARVAEELRRVARPGGRIAASVWPWQPTAMNSLWGEIMAATGTRPERFALPAGEPFDRTEAGLSGLLAEAGWQEVSAWRHDWTFEIEPDELWLGIEAGIATIGQAHAGADAAGRARIRAEYERRTTELAVDGMLVFPVEAILASGRA